MYRILINLLHLRIFKCAVIFSVMFLQLASISTTYHITYSQEDMTELSLLSNTSSHIPVALNKTYHIPEIGFQIMLPEGWSGLDNQNYAIVSPAEMSLKTGTLGDDGDKVMMVIQAVNFSKFPTSLKEYRQGYERSDCKILSDKFLKVNNINSEELIMECDTLEKEKVINYLFLSEKKLIIVGLKGSDPAFNNSLDEFRDSIRSVKINRPMDLERSIELNPSP